MLQIVDGTQVFVVDFDTMPDLPIKGEGIEHYYAVALTNAILSGMISKPGKYAISVDFSTMNYEVYRIIEDHLN